MSRDFWAASVIAFPEVIGTVAHSSTAIADAMRSQCMAEIDEIGFKCETPADVLFAPLLWRVITDRVNVGEWQLTMLSLRAVKQGLVHPDVPFTTKPLYDIVRRSFPIFKGAPPEGHPCPAAFIERRQLARGAPYEAPAPRKRGKGKKGRGHR